MTFPTAIDTNTELPVEAAGVILATNHIVNHTNVRDAVKAIEAKVGADSSAVTTSHDYKLSGVTGSDKAVSKTGTETLTNKTLTSPTITSPALTVGSDATGDIYYRGAGGFTRLAKSTDGKILKLASGLPAWDAEITTSNASDTVKGIVEIATAAEITAGTATGGTGAALGITPDQLALSTPVFNGSGLTNMVAQHKGVFKNGTATKNAADASTTQNIAHGLGVIPKKIKITAIIPNVDYARIATTVYNGTTQSSYSMYGATTGEATTFTLCKTDTGTQTGVITFDATNIIITWTKSGNADGTYTLLWEAEA